MYPNLCTIKKATARAANVFKRSGEICKYCAERIESPSVLKIRAQFTVNDESKQGGEDWLILRKKFPVTASDMPVAVGDANWFKSVDDLITEKTTDFLRVCSESEATLHGQRYEPDALEIYERETSHKLIDPRLNLCVNVLVFGGKVAGTPDGVTYCGILVEVKCPFSRKIGYTIPMQYDAQLQTLLHILELNLCHFVQYDKRNNEMTITVQPIRKEWVNVYNDTVQSLVEEVNTKLHVKRLNYGSIVNEQSIEHDNRHF